MDNKKTNIALKAAGPTFGNFKKTSRGWIINIIGIVALYLLFMLLINQGVISRYYLGILMVVGINIILAASLNLTTGGLGQLALGHAGFMSIGAYVSAIFTKACPDPGIPELLLGLVLGGIVAGLIGLIIGIPALRLKGDYLAIVTLGFGEIIRVIIENIEITGGAQGLRNIPKLTNFTIVYIVVIVCLFILYAFIRSRHGRAVKSICDDPIAARACGVNTTYYRTLVFCLSAVLAGVAGGLYAHYIGILGAKTFGFAKSVEIIVMVVLGGMGSFTGSIASATVLTILPEALREFSTYRMLVYSIVLIIVMIFKPSGLLNRYEFSLTRIVDKIWAFITGKGKTRTKKPKKEPKKKREKKSGEKGGE